MNTVYLVVCLSVFSLGFVDQRVHKEFMTTLLVIVASAFYANLLYAFSNRLHSCYNSLNPVLTQITGLFEQSTKGALETQWVPHLLVWA